ncbi:hypothetical protein H6G76_22235 [Nostoc sp. FACHB-152]|uniref:hypothetical protein n=1 Tax=unclassified Nostoc TaxID=2593658 RepID=UPI001687E374|nr:MULTISPECIES: hypothetical protein [unclassified Nostoc]MBD2449833.1 hypothetical protein [Nostoc sp. FACHB-152]MBD2471588.1 hypothetical protein [Nostoc sp. FACHB-145]
MQLIQNAKRIMSLCLMTLFVLTSSIMILPNSAWAAPANELQSENIVEVMIGFVGLIIGFFLGIFSQHLN